MRRTMRVFVLPAGATLGSPPTPGPELEVEAPTDDAFYGAAAVALAGRGLRPRAVSFTPTGLVAYAEALLRE